MNRIFLFFLIIPLLLGGCDAVNKALGKSKSKAVSYEYTAVKRGTIEKTVSSSGSLEPVATVKVLPRMSGKVEKIFVDYNDPVKKGQVLAELNTDMLKLQRDQQASQVLKARANYNLQQINFANLQKLAEKNLISEYELKSGETTLSIQRADLSVAEANLRSIETEINQYAYITSPIDGTVLERTVNEGDTVVDSSSSNSKAIFTLAENLDEMRIESWVGELDIAGIIEGQEVRFTLESLPGKTFSGLVQSKRLLPSVQDGVVSYNIIINVENKGGDLLPGMTCSVEFIEERRENILLVPNAALRYQPTSMTAQEISDAVFNATIATMNDEQKAAAIERRKEQLAQQTGAQVGGSRPSSGISGIMSGGNVRMPGQGGGNRPTGAGQAGGTQQRGQRERVQTKPLWFMDETAGPDAKRDQSGKPATSGKPTCIMVRVGTSDGANTEVMPVRDMEEAELEGKTIVLREVISR
jgi:HlyD family secretion protein